MFEALYVPVARRADRNSTYPTPSAVASDCVRAANAILEAIEKDTEERLKGRAREARHPNSRLPA